jgi:hypothetical protein
MAKDHRLALDRYIRDDTFVQKKVLNFDELFLSPSKSGQYPWNPSRFTQADLLRKMMTRKLSLNPRLNFVGDTAENYEVFAGLPNFNRVTEYDFATGRALTAQRPEEQPGYNPLWADSYRLSPTIPPEKKIKNPMPRAADPDPRGFLMSSAVNQVKNEEQGKTSVADLLAKKGSTGAPLASVNSKETYKKNNEPPSTIEKDDKKKT